ncbi:hypothetical protein M0802_015158 [Mischocyttarus mexicanus]|nr:hypothetical protein M0802_015158 [Mischocyttarus mexicanus]
MKRSCHDVNCKSFPRATRVIKCWVRVVKVVVVVVVVVVVGVGVDGSGGCRGKGELVSV